MNNEKKVSLTIALLITVVGLIVMFTLTPAGRKILNREIHAVQKADDETNYQTLKKVEDTCRSMIASYTSDKMTWEQYRSSDDKEKQSWADQAKMRANKTAASYNEYILKNSYVWKDAVPDDIAAQLAYLE